MVYGRYNYSFHGVYKVNLNQLITGGHHPVDFTQKQPGFVVRIVDQLWVPSPESWNASTSSTSPPFNCWKGFQDSPTNEIAKTKYSSELQDQCGKSYSLWCSKIPYLFPQKNQTDAPSFGPFCKVLAQVVKAPGPSLENSHRSNSPSSHCSVVAQVDLEDPL